MKAGAKKRKCMGREKGKRKEGKGNEGTKEGKREEGKGRKSP